MTRGKGILRSVAVAAIALAWAGPARADDALPHAFAGDISDFIDNKVPDLSRRKVAADLTRKWDDFFLAVVIEASGVAAKTAADRPNLADLPDPRNTSVADAIQALSRIDQGLAWTRQADRRVSRLREAVVNSVSVCSDAKVHNSGPIADLGLQSVLGGLVPGRPQMYIAWDPTWFSTIASVVYDVLVPGVWYESQKNEAEAALRRYTQKVIQGDQIATLSLASCQASEARADQALKAVASDIAAIGSTLASDQKGLRDLRPAYEAVLVTAGFTQRLQVDGVLKAVSDSDRAELTSGIGEKLDYTLNRLHQDGNASSSMTCNRRVIAEERLSSMAEGTRSQLVAYRQLVGTSHRLDQAASELQTIQARADEWLSKRQRSPCSN